MTRYERGDYLSDVDINYIHGLISGKYKISGFDISASPSSLTISVGTGSGYINGSLSKIDTATTFVLSSDLTYPRKSIIYMNSSGNLALDSGFPSQESPLDATGKKSKTPISPTISSISFPIAEVYIPEGTTVADDCEFFTFETEPIYAYGYLEPATFLIWSESGNYYSKNGATGEILTSGNVLETIYTATVAALPLGNGLIVDKTGHTGMGTQLNKYARGIMYAPEYILQSQPMSKINTVISNFDQGTGEWNNGTSVSDDTTNYRAGSKSLQVLAISSPQTRIYKTGTWDVDSKSVTLRFFIESKSNFNTFGIYFCGPEPWGSNYYTDWVAIPQGYTGSWFEVEMQPNRFSPTGAPDLTQVTRIIIDTYASTATTSVSFDRIGIVEPTNPRGVITLMFDDGDVGVSTAMKPAMDNYGWKGVIFANGNTTTTASLKALFDEGWDIGYHGYTHDYAFPTMSDEAFNRDMIRWLRMMDSLEVLGRYRFAAAPFGSIDDDKMKYMQRYFHFHRLADGTFARYPFTNRMAVQAKSFDGQTPTGSMADINIVESGSYFLGMYWHTAGSGSWTAASWSDFCLSLSTKSIDVLNLSEIMDFYPRDYRYKATGS